MQKTTFTTISLEPISKSSEEDNEAGELARECEIALLEQLHVLVREIVRSALGVLDLLGELLDQGCHRSCPCWQLRFRGLYPIVWVEERMLLSRRLKFVRSRLRRPRPPAGQRHQRAGPRACEPHGRRCRSAQSRRPPSERSRRSAPSTPARPPPGEWPTARAAPWRGNPGPRLWLPGCRR